MASLKALETLFQSIDSGDTAQYLAKLSKQLLYLMNHIDSLNVTSIDTSITTITTEDGSTVIEGPQIKMYDGNNNLRLVMGKNPSSGEFEFLMYNEGGVLTLNLDSNGDIVASSLTINSGNGVANLSDSGALAVLDSVDFNVPGQILNSGDLAVLDSISTTYIDDNAITTPKIFAGAVTASKISVGQLSSISADIGTINAGTINSVTINSSTFRTDSSGERVEIAALNNVVSFYNSSNLLEAQIAGSSLGQMQINAFQGQSMRLASEDDITLDAVNDGRLLGDWYYGFPSSSNEIATIGDINGLIDGVNAGDGLSGGGSSGTVTLNVDDSVTRCSASGVSANGINILYSSFGITIQRLGSSDSITLAWD